MRIRATRSSHSQSPIDEDLAGADAAVERDRAIERGRDTHGSPATYRRSSRSLAEHRFAELVDHGQLASRATAASVRAGAQRNARSIRPEPVRSCGRMRFIGVDIVSGSMFRAG
jgi:hypothetical protein